MQPERNGPFESWIIGYGNPQRRDDGIGPYIVGRLNKQLKQRADIRFRILHQLEPALVEDLRYADSIVLVDATTNRLRDGWECAEIKPESGRIPYTTHHFDPAFMLALLYSIYHRSPQTWLASVQGDDFGFGEGLTPEAEKRANKAVLEIVKLMATKEIDKRDESVKL